MIDTECKSCVFPGEPMCHAECPSIGGSFVCTRPIGHSGNHIACGLERHKIHEWQSNRHLVERKRRRVSTTSP